MYSKVYKIYKDINTENFLRKILIIQYTYTRIALENYNTVSTSF